jgi:hypothetical protein
MGTPFGAASREVGGELRIMSRMGYDATTFGNHEFDLGPDGLGKAIRVAAKAGRVPAVVASNTNVQAADAKLADLQLLSKQGVLRRHLVIERGGIRFGVFGLLGKEATFYTGGKGAVTFGDAIGTAKEVVKALRDATFKVHLDGYNLLPALKGEGEWPRHEFIYWTDDGNAAALRYNDWKISFLRQNAKGLQVWVQPFEELRMPLVENLRMDPFERASDEGAGWTRWMGERMFVFAPAGAYVGQWLQSFRDFPPRQKPGSFSLDRVMEAVTASHKGSN